MVLIFLQASRRGRDSKPDEGKSSYANLDGKNLSKAARAAVSGDVAKLDQALKKGNVNEADEHGRSFTLHGDTCFVAYILTCLLLLAILFFFKKNKIKKFLTRFTLNLSRISVHGRKR